MSSDEKQMSAPTPPSSTSPAAGLGCVYPGWDKLWATARSTARTLTLDPYSEGQESSGRVVELLELLPPIMLKMINEHTQR